MSQENLFQSHVLAQLAAIYALIAGGSSVIFERKEEKEGFISLETSSSEALPLDEQFYLCASRNLLCGGRFKDGDVLIIEPTEKVSKGDFIIVKARANSYFYAGILRPLTRRLVCLQYGEQGQGSYLLRRSEYDVVGRVLGRTPKLS